MDNQNTPPSISLSVCYCHKDAHQLVRMFRWIRILGKLATTVKGNPITLIMVGAKAVPEEIHQFVNREAEKAGFEDIVQIIPDKSDERGWPGSCSFLFVQALDASARLNFDATLFIEPDAFQVHAHWLDKLYDEYIRCGKPFMGVAVPTSEIMVNQGGYHPTHLSGVAIYPKDHRTLAPLLADSATAIDKRYFGECGVAWDIYAAPQTVPQMHETDLIIHRWSDKVNPVKDLVENPNAVLYHQSKDDAGILTCDKIVHKDKYLADPKARFSITEANTILHSIVRGRIYKTTNATIPFKMRNGNLVEWEKTRFLGCAWHGKIHTRDMQLMVDLGVAGYKEIEPLNG